MSVTDRFYMSREYEEKSQEALNLALDTVPFYRSWQAFDPGREYPSELRYAAMPELTKADIRLRFPNGLVSGGRDVARAVAADEIEYTFTSGTTGEKVANLWNQNWWHAGELASWKLSRYMLGFVYPQRQATLTSALNCGIHYEEDLPMDHRIMGNVLYLNEKINVLSIGERHLKRMAEELEVFRPVILEANPSLLARLAYWAIDHDKALYAPAVIVLTYELPSRLHLDAIRSVFSSPVVSSYGTTETGFVLMSCEDGMMHQNTRFCHIDYVPLPEEAGGPELGRILVTNFNNPWSVMVRFDVGDLVRIAPSGTCSCGRGEGMLFTSVEGRAANTTFTVTGKPVTTAAVDAALAAVPELRDYRLTQRSRTEYELLIVSTDPSQRIIRECRQILGEVYGSGAFELRMLPELLPGPSGKYRRTAAGFAFDERTLQICNS